MLIGPRQRGKTTLVQQLADKDREYVTLDDTLCFKPLATIPLSMSVDSIWSPSTKCKEPRNS
jgi:hypothetical protein